MRMLRQRRPHERRCLALAFMLVITLLDPSSAAEAQSEWRPAGSISAGVLFQDGNPGPGLIVDLWEPVGLFNIGGALGVAAVTAAQEEETQAFMPAGVSVALRLPVGRGAIDLGARGGLWAGARKEGLRVGPWASGGLRLSFPVDDSVWISLSGELWFMGGESSSLLWMPQLGITWDLSNHEEL